MIKARVWAVVDEDGAEWLMTGGEPEKVNPGLGHTGYYALNYDGSTKKLSDVVEINVPKGTVELLAGRKITWADAPVELKEANDA